MAALMEIIIRAIDKASDVATKVEGKLTQMGGQTAKAMEKASKAGDQFTQTLNKTGTTGQSAYAQLGSRQQQYLQGLSKSQGFLDRMGIAGTRVGTVLSRSYEKASTVATNAFNKMKEAGTRAASSIKSSLQNAANGANDLSTAIGSVIAGFGLMEIATMATGGAMKAQFNEAMLTRKFGPAAKGLASDIRDIVSIVPGDDTFMNELLSGAAYKAGIQQADVLKTMGYAAADYMASSQAMGKSQIETQMDLKEYLLTGNTTQLERDSILKSQLGTLKGQTSVQDRINALNTALTAEGYNGVSLLDIAGNKWELVKGKVQGTATVLGLQVLPFLEGVLDKFIALDDATGGWSTGLLLAAGVGIAVAASVGMIAGPLLTAGGALNNLQMGFRGVEGASGVMGRLGTSINNLGSSLKDTIHSVYRYVTGQRASTIATTTNTTAVNTSTIATIRSTAANWWNSASQKAQAAATWLHNGAKTVYNFLTSGQVIATVSATAAAVANTVATKAQAAATWLFNAALSANPLVWVAVAIIALVAALWYLYNTNETVRNGINWLWGGLQQIGGYIYGGLLSAWNALTGAFSSAGNAAQGALGGALSWLGGILGWVGGSIASFIGWLYGILYGLVGTNEAIRQTTTKFGILGYALSYLLNPMGFIMTLVEDLGRAWDAFWKSAEGQGVMRELGAAFGEVSAALDEVWAALAPIGPAFSELWAAIFPVTKGAKASFAAVKDVGGAVKGAGGAVKGAMGPLQIATALIKALGWVISNIVIPLVKYLAIVIRAVAAAINFLMPFFKLLITWAIAVWTTVRGVTSAISAFSSTLLTIFWDLINGNITLQEAFSRAWAAIQGLVNSAFTAIITGIGLFVVQLINWAIIAASGLVNTFIAWLSQLPRRAWSYFLSFLSYLARLPGQAASYANRVGSNIISAIGSYLASLPGRMYTWGVNALNSFVNAIINSIPGLRAALNAVSALFPRSPPKTGPLSTIKVENMRKWMAGIGEAMNVGLEEGSGETLSNFVDGFLGKNRLKKKFKEDSFFGISEKEELEITVNEVLDLNVNVSLEDVPQTIDESVLLNVLKGIITDSDVVNALIKNRNFRNRLNTELGKGVASKKRVIGV